MPESIRNMITQPSDRAPCEATTTQAVTEPAPAPADEETIRASVLAEQKARMSGINDLFAMFGGRYQALQAADDRTSPRQSSGATPASIRIFVAIPSVVKPSC